MGERRRLGPPPPPAPPTAEVTDMVKRLFLIVALAATFAACSPSGGATTAPGLETVAPVESMGLESASPAP